MAKRANNEGTIRKRTDGRWEARYYDAGRKMRSLYAKTQAEAKDRLHLVLQQLSSGDYCEPSRMTVAFWLDTWWREYCVPATRKNSAAAAMQSISKHLIPSLGSVPLQQLRADQVQRLINRLVTEKYAPATIRRIMATLRTSLQQAVTNQLIIKNPASGVKLPVLQQKEIVIFTVDEQRSLLEAMPDTDNGRALRFILGTGLRSSELCGLRWQDIKGNAFTVNQAITTYLDYEEEGGPANRKQTAPPKSAAGRRTIPLTPAMLSLLDEQRRAQLVDKEAAISKGMGWPMTGLVFTTPAGQPKDRANLSRTLRQALDKAGLAHRGVHALRHTFAQNAMQSAVDYRTLSELLGHSKVAFTLQTYAHSDMEIKRKALETMDIHRAL